MGMRETYHKIFVMKLNDENVVEKIKDEYDEQIFENYDRL